MVGVWKQDSVTNEWNFMMCEKYQAKHVDISVVRSYDDLVSLLEDSFEIDSDENKISITYWAVDESIIFTHPIADQLVNPPVELASNEDLTSFLILLGRRPDTNLYVSLMARDKVSNGLDGKLPEVEESLSQEFPVDDSFLALLEKVEDENRKKRRLEEGAVSVGKGCADDDVIRLNLTGNSVLRTLGGVDLVVGSPCTPLVTNRIQTFSPLTAGSYDVVETPEICGRGRPTLEETGLGTVGDGSVWYRAADDGGVNTPINPYEMERARKGKGIYVGDNSDERSSCEFPRFDLGIEEINGCVEELRCASRPQEHLSASVNLVDFPTSCFVDPPPQMTYLPSPDEEGLIHVGCVFANKKELHMALSLLALEKFFCFKIGHSDKSRVYAVCVDPKCGWRVSCKCFPDSDNVEVFKIVPQHTCGASARSRYVEKATSRVLAQLLNSKFANGKQGPRACNIPDVVLSEMKVPITYMKAWYAKEMAVASARGRAEENFRLLTRYLKALTKANPGTLTDIQSTVNESGDKQFMFLFVALSAAMAGWPYVRKVVGIDGTHMKGKYKGCLVSACCQDGNFQILPLAIGVVDSENIDSWVWFLENLTQIVTDDPGVVFVSDRHPSIYAALKRVFPQSTHVFCIVHLVRNVKQMFKCGGLANMVNRCARAYTKTDFRYWWTQIENLSPECAQYLKKEGLSYWARSYCTGMRYNLMSGNICESFNHAIGKAVEYPILTMVEFVRTMMMQWFKERRDAAGKCRTRCTPTIEKVLVQNLKVASDMKIIAADRFIYQVNDTRGWSYTVDLKNRCCTCNAFQSLKIPCSHALGAMRMNKDDIYSFVGAEYGKDIWVKIYKDVIHPVPTNDDEAIDENCEFEELLPPNTKRPPGRPRSARIRSSGECFKKGSGRSSRCGRCSEYGHNRATCKNPI